MRRWAWIGLAVLALSPGSARPAAQERAAVWETVSSAAPIPAEPASDLTGDQMMERYRLAVAQIQRIAGEIRSKLNSAQAARDVIRANCLGERLSQVNGLLKSGEAASVLLKEAVAAHDSESMAREYSNIIAGRKKVDELAAAADGCVGQSGGDNAPAAVETVVPELGRGSQIGSQEAPFVRPPPASPTS